MKAILPFLKACVVLALYAGCSKIEKIQDTTSDPVTDDFFAAVTQTHAQYKPFEGYDALEKEADLVVVGQPLSLSKGPTWRFSYGNPNLEVGHRNMVSLALRVDKVVKGDAPAIVHIRFSTGLADGSAAKLPMGVFKAYLIKAVDVPGLDDPRRGLPAGADAYILVRPEGFSLESNGEIVAQPMMSHGAPIAPEATGPRDPKASGSAPNVLPSSAN